MSGRRCMSGRQVAGVVSDGDVCVGRRVSGEGLGSRRHRDREEQRKRPVNLGSTGSTEKTWKRTRTRLSPGPSQYGSVSFYDGEPPGVSPQTGTFLCRVVWGKRAT